MEKNPTILFLHIPKAAGTTLSRILERNIPAKRQYRLGPEAQASLEHFHRMPRDKRSQYRLVSGHFPYGVHEKIPGEYFYFTMDAIHLAGLTERFHASLLLLGKEFGWNNLGYRKANQTRKRPAVSELDEETRETLADLNRLDLELYAYAKERFESLWRNSGLDDSTFSANHPAPGPLKEKIYRIRSRTPSECLCAFRKKMISR